MLENKKGWKKLSYPNVKNFGMFHDSNFVRPHKGKDAGIDFFDCWNNSNSRIYDLFTGSGDWRQRKHKRKVIKPEHNTEDYCKNCGCGCWHSLNLPPFEEKERFIYYEGLYSLILLFNKYRNYGH
jgi:hypothetical protein